MYGRYDAVPNKLAPVARAPVTAREGAAVFSAFVRYRGSVLPRVRRELASWREAATRIPDRTLREQAVEAVTDKASNAEATAVLATIAPRRSRRAVCRASSALQVAVDYLDSLGETPGPDPLRDGLELHGALAAALDPGERGRNWYVHHPQQEDGGYLDRLVAACRDDAARLPSAEIVLPLARRAAIRCGEGQSYTHATGGGASESLRQWASGLAAPAGFEWWEVAAGASSSVAAHALLALAGVPDATRAEAELVDSVYFPSLGALTVLLDDLVDLEADRQAGEHSYLRYYPSDEAAAERLEEIVARARDSISRLTRPAPHEAILAGTLAFYLASPGAVAPEARAIRDRLISSSGPVVRSLTRVLERGHRG
jgi:tetraprenyl-beta-curcumene synthase